jgi:hypothetical protein
MKGYTKFLKEAKKNSFISFMVWFIQDEVGKKYLALEEKDAIKP